MHHTPLVRRTTDRLRSPLALFISLLLAISFPLAAGAYPVIDPPSVDVAQLALTSPRPAPDASTNGQPANQLNGSSLQTPDHSGSTKPAKVKSNLILPLALVGAALMVMPADHTLSNDLHSTKADVATSTITHFGEPAVLAPAIAGMYFLGGKEGKDDARLAADALINATILTELGKTLAGRARPTVPGVAGDFTGPNLRSAYASFPSGHTAAAFAVARVMAKRHPKQKWLYYGLAAAVGFARVRTAAHFPSDVLVGAGVGIFSGDQALKSGHNFLTVKF